MPDNGSLLTAMLAVQKDAPTLKKDTDNPGFRGAKYAPLDTIVETIRGLLAENGLVWSTKPSYDATTGEPTLKYKLAHAPTKECEEGEMKLLLAQPNAQGQGSAITYARRYALCAVLNLVADDDDDGNAASPQKGTNGAQASTPRMGSTPATDKQVALVKRLFTKHNLGTREKCSLLRGAGVGLPPMRDEAEATAAVDTAVKGLFKHQASALLDVLNEGPVPTGESDVPADTSDFKEPREA